MPSRWPILAACLCLLAPATRSEGAIRPFVLAGGSALKAEKTDLNEWLDKYTVRQSGGSWEAGGGLRLVPGVSESSRADQGANGPAARSPIEIRLRLTLGGGGLPGAQFVGERVDYSFRHRFPVSSRERFTYRSWALGAFFSTRVYDSLGFFLGPVLQTVNFEADRSWSGRTDCPQCGPAKDKATSRYGAMEAGLHYTLHQYPLRFEGYWVPKRVDLTTTHILQSENYEANFATFKSSFGARASWEF
jgi:hypothetical protein